MDRKPVKLPREVASEVLPSVMLALAIEAVQKAGRHEFREDHVRLVNRSVSRLLQPLDAMAQARASRMAAEWSTDAMKRANVDTPEEVVAAVSLVVVQMQGTEYARPEWNDAMLVAASIASEHNEAGGYGPRDVIARGAGRMFDRLMELGALRSVGALQP